MSPISLPREGHYLVKRRLGDNREADPFRRVKCSAVQLVEQRRAGWTRAFLQRQPRRSTIYRPGPLVAGIAREHEVVDHERVVLGREQVAQPELTRPAVAIHTGEDVVDRHFAAGWEVAAFGRDGFHQDAQLTLASEQPIARLAVLGGFVREGDFVSHVANNTG